MTKRKITLDKVGEIYEGTRVDVLTRSEKRNQAYIIFGNVSLHYREASCQLQIDAGNYFTCGSAGIRLFAASDEIELISFNEDEKVCYITFTNGFPPMWITPTDVEKYRGYPDERIPQQERAIVPEPCEE